MIVFDTNVISELIKPDPDSVVFNWSRSLAEPTFITAVTVAEMRSGVALLPAGKRKSSVGESVEKAVADYYLLDRVLSFDVNCTSHFAQVIASRKAAGKPIGIADALIAATCLAHGFVLATRNEADFADTGVRIVNPWS